MTVLPTEVALGVLFGSFVFHIIANKISSIISSATTVSYKKLSASQKANWDSRVVSNIHALIAFVTSSYALLQPEYWGDYLLTSQTPFMQLSLLYSLGYFFYDLLLLLIHKELADAGTLAHHVIAIIAAVLVLIYGQSEWGVSFFMFTEVTTPFINQRWFFDACDMRANPLYVVNGLLIFIGWTIARVVLLFLAAYKIITAPDYQATIFIMHIAIPALLIGITFLNLFWYYKITKGIVRVLVGSKSAKAE